MIPPALSQGFSTSEVGELKDFRENSESNEVLQWNVAKVNA
jgi:hypothetical protein